jgi:hypothetical protein
MKRIIASTFITSSSAGPTVSTCIVKALRSDGGSGNAIRAGAGRGRGHRSDLLILYWRRKEQELAAAAERDIPGPLRAALSGEDRWITLSRI